MRNASEAPDSTEIANETAVLSSPTEPTQEQYRRFADFLRRKYRTEIPLIWEKDDTLQRGFRLTVGTDIYDWSLKGRLHQLEEQMEEKQEQEPNANQKKMLSLLRETVENWKPAAEAAEIGTVLTVGDGVATVGGLEHAAYGEILIFASGVKGMVQELRPDRIGCIFFSESSGVTAGSPVYRSGKTAGVPVGDAFLGRVVDALGAPLDGKDPIEADGYRPIESPAPGIIDRQSVNRPLETGLLVIDSMFPIGRGQRELIIGDRQTGKTAVALDTILNQKGKNVVCIYVAIGQKDSAVAHLAEILRKRGAMEYCIIVNASASAAPSLQYIAPYTGCSLAEHFMYAGRDVLIVYDDLSKHAVAYRTLSLLMERSPGREAYPGDVFYLHSRLLERAAHLSDANGGGSITALPIIETQAGDVSAYIPTNVISITDGQIFLESGLFHSGQRPAVNVGLSVSRVGGAAQTKAVKQATGSLRIDLAQFREMEVFTQFAGELDEMTARRLAYGQGLMRLLRQEQYRPMCQSEQVAALVAALSHTMQDIPPDEIPAFRDRLLAEIKSSAAELCARIDREGKLSEKDRNEIVTLSKQFLQRERGAGEAL